MARQNETGKQKEAKCKRCNMNTCTEKMKGFLSRVFTCYGTAVGRHPLPFIIIPLLLFGGLGAGLLALDEETDMEKVYFPMNSRATKDRQTVRDTFPDLNNESYNSFSQSDADKAVSLLFKSDNGSILAANAMSEIESIVKRVKALGVDVAGRATNFSHFCARFASQCVIAGEIVLSQTFKTALAAGKVTYPYWAASGGRPEDLSGFLGGAELKNGVLVSATVLKVSFKVAEMIPAWQDEFESLAESLDLDGIQVTHETPDSLNVELDKSTTGDIIFFSLTITLCCTYASVVATGGNPVSTRGMLSFAGILAAGLGILGSMGLLSLCGVKFVNIVGVVPFLIIGIGIDDMFLLMSSWSESIPSNDDEKTVESVPFQLGRTFASAGIGITITSLTDFFAFVIGTTSVFLSVTNFSLYAGVAVIFCYICNVTLFGGCLAYHGRRVYSSRHFLTCLKTKPREELKKDHSACVALVCGGAKPKGERDDESFFELLPRKLLPKLFNNSLVCLFIIMLFLMYLGVAIYGTVHLNQGLVLKNLVSESSYYHKYLTLTDQYFPVQLPIGFVVNSEIDYAGGDGQRFLDLQSEARKDSDIHPDFERCWLTAYRNSTYFDATAPQHFVSDLQRFLAAVPDFVPDVVFGLSNANIIASRCFVMSKPNTEQYELADLMIRMRDLAQQSPLSVFAYHYAFVAYEQFISVLPATLQMVGCAVAVMTVITFIFLPHVLMVLLVIITILMILTGIFGFMYFWNITLSSITMIHLVMSVGFSVDFSTHVCSAYLISDSSTRQGRARDAISHAAGPIFNGGMSTLMGVIILVASDSYIFVSFFRIMVLVIVFGMMHAVFFLPAVLSVMGPTNKCAPNDIELRPRATSSTPPADYE